MERANFTLLLYLSVPINLFIASHTSKRLRFLYAALQLILYFAVILLIPPGLDPSSDYVFGTSMRRLPAPYRTDALYADSSLQHF